MGSILKYPAKLIKSHVYSLVQKVSVTQARLKNVYSLNKKAAFEFFVWKPIADITHSFHKRCQLVWQHSPFYSLMLADQKV